MRFRASETFWKHFYDLGPTQKESVRRAWKIFRENPFDQRLRTHKIHRLSAALGKTVYAVEIEADLRAVFYLEGDVAHTVDIGSHGIYR
jgi:hypothetical protein